MFNQSNVFKKATLVTLAMSTLSLMGCGHRSMLQTTKAPKAYRAKSKIKPKRQFKALNRALLKRKQPRQVIIKRRASAQLNKQAYQAFSSRYKTQVSRRVKRLGVEVVNVPQGMSYKSFLRQLKQDNSIAFAEPNYIKHISIKVDDPHQEGQYGLEKMQVNKAWDISMGSKAVTVAVIDTGVDLEHPDLINNMVPGFSAIKDHPSPADDNGHGTHVAGIVAASANNGIGIAGMAPNTKIMPIKVLSKEGFGDDAGIAEGIIWAADHGADIINMSLGGEGTSQTLEEAINYALRKNITVLAAMGNDGGEIVNYPAAQGGVIAVGSTDQEDLLSDFSNVGDWIQLTAPGSAILSTFPTYEVELNEYGYTRNYAVLDGTSMATPYAAGLAALLLSQKKMNPRQVLSHLKRGSVDLGTPGFDVEFGFGRINAFQTLKPFN